MKDLNYFIVIGSDDDFGNFSSPILINKPITRSAFGIQHQDTNVNRHIFFFIKFLEFFYLSNFFFAMNNQF